MRGNMFSCIDKSVGDEIRELRMYAPYCDMPDFANPWIVRDRHSISNDIAMILAALED